MKIIITETKLRKIIKFELQNYFLEESISFFNTLKKALGVKQPPSTKTKEFSEIQKHVEYLLPNFSKPMEQLYSILFNPSAEIKLDANKTTNLISFLNELKNIVKEKYEIPVAHKFRSLVQENEEQQKKQEKTENSTINKLFQQLIQIDEKLSNLENEKPKSDDATAKGQHNAFIIASKITSYIINLVNLCLKLQKVESEVKENFDKLIDKVIKQFQTLIDTDNTTNQTQSNQTQSNQTQSNQTKSNQSAAVLSYDRNAMDYVNQ